MTDPWVKSQPRPEGPASPRHSTRASAPKKGLPLANVTEAQWDDWRWQVRNQITTAADLEPWVSLTIEEKRAIEHCRNRFQFALTPYYASLMDPTDFFCPIRRQAIPVDEEFRTSFYDYAHLNPQAVRVAGGHLVHPFPDRAVLSIHSQCVVYCRFCPQRKAPTGKLADADGVSGFLHNALPSMTRENWKEITQYLQNHPDISEVIVTGGEPLLLNDELLRDIFSHLRSIPSVKSLRLQTRILSALPQRITSPLVQILKEFQPLYLVIHVNHPREISEDFSRAAALLADSGIPLVSETVLLHDINDKPQVLSELFLTLFKQRVRPYRMVQAAPSMGTDHFRTSISLGIKLMENLRTRMPGLALPEYVVDTAGGRIPLRYESILSRNKRRILLKNYEGKVFIYPEKIVSISS